MGAFDNGLIGSCFFAFFKLLADFLAAMRCLLLTGVAPFGAITFICDSRSKVNKWVPGLYLFSIVLGSTRTVLNESPSIWHIQHCGARF